MKFAKELESELVPEWRAKYLDYKTGKKKLKAITRAQQRSNRSPYSPSLRRNATSSADQPNTPSRGPPRSSSHPSDKRLEAVGVSQHQQQQQPQTSELAVFDSPIEDEPQAGSVPRSIPIPRNERQPLRTPGSRFSGTVGSYGSIIATPPQTAPSSDLASLKLPDPAIDPADECLPPHKRPSGGSQNPRTPSPVMSRRDPPRSTPASQTGAASSDRKPSLVTSKSWSGPRRSHLPSSLSRRLMQRMFSSHALDSPGKGVQLEQYSEINRRQDDFFAFLDSELEKIESFYQMKETEATQRLQVLREQLHIMRDRRIEDVAAAKKANHEHSKDADSTNGFLTKFNHSRLRDTLIGRDHIGKNSRALAQMGPAAGTQPSDTQYVSERRDFTRRQPPKQPAAEAVPYRNAKRKLKYAMQEFYRGLELLKSYAYMNRTAFRKINKKYDKTVHARPTMRYISEKVNKAWFVQSEVVDTLLVAVEDLYARYFERGNRKIAVSKLRRMTAKKTGDFSSNSFRSGILFTAGALLSIQALIYAVEHLKSTDPILRLRTSYLLQIYGGYFLIIFHFLLFALDCMVWTKAKINYVFVFEFDTRHALDWRQLAELPCLFLTLLGISMWLNFTWVNDMYIYWPVVLTTVMLGLLFLPAPILYHRTRKWWAYSNWRLLLAGLYPVEFRDFFLGDMYCSQTYAMGNIELFFCLYATHWGSPPQCNSSHSRLLGFFTCLPSIWRALQCLRRFRDTGHWFPHLANFVKYLFGVLYYATLSMYRIDMITQYQAPFITFALLNALYVSAWDLLMDWSLGNLYAKRPLLRDVTGFRNTWVYYVAMVLDVIVRNNWIFYVIFIGQLQHSAVLSFFVSFAEICRRGMWTIFRVENEHCTNVIMFRASRDVPLPYETHPSDEQGEGAAGAALTVNTGVRFQDYQTITTPFLAPAELELGRPAPPSTPGIGRRQSFVGGLGRMGTIMAHAHAQDFQRRNPATGRSGVAGVAGAAGDASPSPDDTSDEEDSGVQHPYTDHVIEEEHTDVTSAGNVTR